MSGQRGEWLEWLWPDGSGGKVFLDPGAAAAIGSLLAEDGARVWIEGKLAAPGWQDRDEAPF